MKEKLLEVKSRAMDLLAKTDKKEEIENLRVQFLGKKGEITALLRTMGSLPAEERPEMGKLANEIREKLEGEISDYKRNIDNKIKADKLANEKIDVTMPSDYQMVGRRHPLMLVKEELEEVFLNMGYDVIEGPEVDTVKNNFDDLNAPKDHPSRDKSDTFYLSDDIVLRTQTSTVQIRTMKNQKPPIKMVSAGRTFRFDEVDDTHSPMFHQMECLVVDKGITMANLKDSIDQFVREMFGENMQTRFRPHNFPFTEPSAEVDVSCFKCKGKGCPACNGTGWSMELLGCGMVHPNVLKNCGIDPDEYSGFAFGIGVDRLTMIKYGITDIRMLFENDARFLQQF